AQTGPLPTGHTLSLQSDFNEHSLTATFKSRDGIELTNLGDATVRGTSSFYEISCVLSGGTVDLRNTELHFTNKANQRQGVDNRSFSGTTITTTKTTLGFRQPLLMEKGWLSFTVEQAPTEAVTLTCARTSLIK